jgi:hypothetical protein
MLAQRNCVIEELTVGQRPIQPCGDRQLSRPHAEQHLGHINHYRASIAYEDTKIRRYEDYKSIRKPPLVFVNGILANHISFRKSFFIIFQQIYCYFQANDVTH